jgi:hypothetical protein
MIKISKKFHYLFSSLLFGTITFFSVTGDLGNFLGVRDIFVDVFLSALSGMVFFASLGALTSINLK